MWNDLGMKERADLMGIFLRNGIRSLNEMKDIYNNSFQDGGRKWDSSRAKKERYSTLDLSGIRTTSDRPYNTGYAEYLYHAFRDSLNYTPAQTAAIVGTAIEESGADPFARSKNGTYNGLLQWARDRYVPNPDNTDKQELDAQIHHIDSTLNAGGGHNWTHGGIGSGFRTWEEPYEGFWDESSDTDEAVDYLNWGYVRPRGKQESNENRKRTSRQVNQKVSGRYLKKFNE